MEEVAGPRPQTTQLQSHMSFVQAKLGPLVNANEIAELRVSRTLGHDLLDPISFSRLTVSRHTC